MGSDPYRLLRRLDDTYRPIGYPDTEPSPPRFPGRVKRLLYGFAAAAETQRIEELKAMIGRG